MYKNQLVPDLKPGSPEEVVVKRLTNLWANFARYGDPNPKEKDELIDVDWKPVRRDELNCLNIDTELSIEVNPEAERVAFWDGLYEEFPEAKFW